MLLVGLCSAVALFGFFIEIEQNGKIVTIFNSLKMYFLIHKCYTTVQQIFSMELIFGENTLPHVTFLNCRCHFIISE